MVKVMVEATHRMLGNSAEFLRVLHAARMVAGTETPVLIGGERGVGKATLAREIHIASQRRQERFVSINCAGIEAFGPELSDLVPGTLFFDAVGELTQRLQTELLHRLEAEDRMMTPPRWRLLASADCELRQLVKQGKFREDLYYRLYVVPLDLPSLRERSDDIVLLLKYFTQELARFHKRRAPRFSVTARNLLKGYAWPGNLRELRNMCERLVILMPGKIIQPDNLPLEIRRASAGQSEQQGFRLPADGIDLLALEGDMIKQALGMAGGNRSQAARLLGISRDTLLYRIRKHAIPQ